MKLLLIDTACTLLLAAHLLCMNIASAGPLLCVWMHWRVRPDVEAETEARRQTLRLAVWSVLLLVLGGVAGIGLGWLESLAGGRRIVAVLGPFSNKVWWGVGELACYLAWMGGYVLWLSLAPPQRTWQRGLHHLLPILSATNLLYHFPPLLTVLAKAASGEFDTPDRVDATQFRLLAWSPDVVAHTLHFWLASAAVGGVFLMGLPPSERGAHVRLAGARLALAASLAQIPVGVWLLAVLPPVSQSRVLGGDLWGAGLFVASVLCGFYLIQNLVSASLSMATDLEFRRIACLMILTILLMSGTLRGIRVSTYRKLTACEFQPGSYSSSSSGSSSPPASLSLAFNSAASACAASGSTGRWPAFSRSPNVSPVGDLISSTAANALSNSSNNFFHSALYAAVPPSARAFFCRKSALPSMSLLSSLPY